VSARSRTPSLQSSSLRPSLLSLFTLLFPSPPFPALFLFPSHAPLLCVKHCRLSSPSPLRPSASLQSSADSTSARPVDLAIEKPKRVHRRNSLAFFHTLIKTNPRVHRIYSFLNFFSKFQAQFSETIVRGKRRYLEGGISRRWLPLLDHRHTHAKAVCTRVRHERRFDVHLDASVPCTFIVRLCGTWCLVV